MSSPIKISLDETVCYADHNQFYYIFESNLFAHIVYKTPVSINPFTMLHCLKNSHFYQLIYNVTIFCFFIFFSSLEHVEKKGLDQCSKMKRKLTIRIQWIELRLLFQGSTNLLQLQYIFNYNVWIKKFTIYCIITNEGQIYSVRNLEDILY